MKLKVLKKFSDKNTSELYLEGTIIDVKEDRAKELLNHPLDLVEIYEYEMVVEAPTNEDKETDDFVEEVIEEFKKEQEIEAKNISEDIIALEAKEAAPKRTRKKKAEVK